MLESSLARNSGRKQPILVSVSTHFLPSVMSPFTCITENTGLQQSVRRSIRPNKGSGGQIAHLQNIERILTEPTTTSRQSHAAQLDKATANEPLNPMAPMRLKPKPRIKTSSTREPDSSVRSGLELVCRTLHFYRSTTHELTGVWR